MDLLWAPWRMSYIRGDRAPDDNCIFCAMRDSAGHDADAHVIARSPHNFVTLNKYPYSNGHLMIVPNAHVSSLEDLPVEAQADLMALTSRCLRALRQLYQPPAFNIGANIGGEAGAGIAAHFHFHIVPRWAGDVNFMTSIANTRVIPDSLDNVYRDLKATWVQLYDGGDAEG